MALARSSWTESRSTVPWPVTWERIDTLPQLNGSQPPGAARGGRGEGLDLMKISFDIAGVPAEFRSSPWTGRIELRVADDVIVLLSPYDPRGWFAFRGRRVWRRRVGDHDVEIVRLAPYGGTRPQTVTISVDNTVVAKAHGV